MKIGQQQARIEAIGDQLRTKIQSKFQATTFLGSFCLSLLGIVTSIYWADGNKPVTLPFIYALLSVACILLFNAVRVFDELTMPKRFWAERELPGDRSESREGSLTEADLWNLKKLMVFFWAACVMAAVPIALIALLLLLIPVASSDTSRDSASVFLGAGGGCVIGILYCFVLERVRKKRFPELVRPLD